MDKLKFYSKIFSWSGRIFIFILIILEFAIRFLVVPSDSWFVLNSSEIIGVRNMLLVMAPFSLLIGCIVENIYIELEDIKHKVRKMKEKLY